MISSYEILQQIQTMSGMENKVAAKGANIDSLAELSLLTPPRLRTKNVTARKQSTLQIRLRCAGHCSGEVNSDSKADLVSASFIGVSARPTMEMNFVPEMTYAIELFVAAGRRILSY